MKEEKTDSDQRDAPAATALSASRDLRGDLLRLVPAIFVGLFVFVLINTAWLNDDSYITFRSVENLMLGHGPVWNPGERVQSYSHALWFWLIAGARWLTGELYWSVLACSMAISLGAVAVLAWSARRSWARQAVVVGLASCSAAFVDYSTSGLENPLSHLLFGLFFLAYAGSGSPSLRRLAVCGFIAGLAVLNRQDVALMYLPAMLFELWSWARVGGALTGQRSPRTAVAARLAGGGGLLLVSAGPLLLWMLFSLFYYGFPFPNTAYAKLATSVPRGDLLLQGLRYVQDLAGNDPVTAGVIAAGFAVGLSEGSGRMRAIAAGMLSYVAYVVWIGGDFMSGRFFALPFYGGVLVLGSAQLAGLSVGMRRVGAGAAGALVVLGMMIAPERSPLLGSLDKPELWVRRPYPQFGIEDERGHFYPWTGLLRENARHVSVDDHQFGKLGTDLLKHDIGVSVLDCVGIVGWRISDRFHVVDLFALADPLLARLPSMHFEGWRIGHYRRRVPDGYVRSLLYDENLIEDPILRGFYDDLRLATRGPLLSVQRLGAIWRLNRNPVPEVDVESFRRPSKPYIEPGYLHFRAEDLADRNGEPMTFERSEAFTIHWRQPIHGRFLEILPAPAGDHAIYFTAPGMVSPVFVIGEGEQDFRGRNDGPARIRVPPWIAEAGFDSLTLAATKQIAGSRAIRTVRVIEDPSAEAREE